MEAHFGIHLEGWIIGSGSSTHWKGKRRHSSGHTDWVIRNCPFSVKLSIESSTYNVLVLHVSLKRVYRTVAVYSSLTQKAVSLG